MNKFTSTGLFKHTRADKNFVPKFEERTVLAEATDTKAVEALIREDFENYASDGIILIAQSEVNEVFEEEGLAVIEVGSVVRTSPLENEEYIQQYWNDLKPNSCETNGWDCSWYKKDENTLGCYNCRMTKKAL